MIIYSQKNPARFMLSGFLFIILWGTLVLLLPQPTGAAFGAGSRPKVAVSPNE